MKKIVLAAFVALSAATVFAAASDVSADVRVGYMRAEGGVNGVAGGVGGYYSLLKDAGFLQNLSVGLDFDVLHVSGTTGVFVGPVAKAVMPYSYAKVGFGYEKFVNSALGLKVSLGGLMPVADGMKVGLDFTFGEKLTNGSVWTIAIGPVFSIDL